MELRLWDTVSLSFVINNSKTPLIPLLFVYYKLDSHHLTSSVFKMDEEENLLLEAAYSWEYHRSETNFQTGL